MSRGETNSSWYPVLRIAGLALVWRYVYYLLLDPVLDSADSVLYLQTATELFHRNFAAVDQRIPILYPVLVACAHKLTREVEFAGIVVSLICSSLIPPVIFCIARDMFGKRTAYTAAFLTVFWPWLVDYGSRVAPESLAVLLWLLAVASLWRASEGKPREMLLSIAAFFLLHLSRPEGTFLLLFSPVVLTGLLLYRHRRLVLRMPACLVGGYTVLLLIQLGVFRALFGTAFINARVPRLADSLEHTFITRGDAWLRAGLELWSRVLPTMIGPYLFLFIGVGLVYGSKEGYLRRLQAESVFGLFSLAQLMLAAFSTFAEPRYVMPVVVITSLWAARGIEVLSNKFYTDPKTRPLAHMPMAGALALFFIGTVQAILPEYHDPPRLPREYKTVGTWMKQHLAPGLILNRKPQIGFYAGMPTTGPANDETIETLVERAKRSQIRYVVIDERYTAQVAPALRPLLAAQQVPPALRLLRDDLSPYAGARVVVYEMVCLENTSQKDYRLP